MALFRNHTTPTPVPYANGGSPPPPVSAPVIAAPPLKNAPGEFPWGQGNGTPLGGGRGGANTGGAHGMVSGAGYTPPPEFRKVREDVQQYLVNEVKSFTNVSDPDEMRRLAEPVFNKAVMEANLVVSREEREHLLNMIMADILGYGPIQPLLDRDDITEVMVNGPESGLYRA